MIGAYTQCVLGAYAVQSMLGARSEREETVRESPGRETNGDREGGSGSDPEPSGFSSGSEEL